MYSVILHGTRSTIEKWRNLRLAVNFLQNASAFSNSFSSASVFDVTPRDGRRKGKSFTVSYLVDSLGLTKNLAESISRKLSLEDKRNPDSILSLFRSYGFTDTQISSIITDYPGLLLADAEKSIGPKLKLLLSMKGASSSELTEIVSKVPEILGKDRSICMYYDSVKCIIEADKRSSYEKLSHSFPQNSLENKVRNVSVLRELGMPQRLLLPLLVLKCPHVCGKERFEESLKKVVEMGFDPTTSKFVLALRMLYQMSDKTIEDKKTEFVVKKMNWSLKALASNPAVFGYNMEKRIVPRCNVIKALLSKGLLGKGSELPPVSSVLSCTDEKFLNKYVMKHEKLEPELMAIYIRERAS
ncbi:hypothetical protein EUTSA_v10024090mg [Eutrema salsugineum]|uniref:Mitochondrial transcription termination factor family protein n=1 Tax=Eutrema salsugineum TaxID=72664 RepID=V4KHA0_EUTSA|nr:hypothetical protein EUTSA_v10024090mg [Eutrema salsugineum]